MKKLISLLTLLLASGVLLLAAPGQTRPLLAFTWEPPPPIEEVDAYYLYVSTNLLPGMSVPVPAGVDLLSWYPTPDQTNIFKPLMRIPGSATSVELTNVWASLGQHAFFTITASNSVGESDFSNVAWVPAPPSSRDRQFRVEVR